MVCHQKYDFKFQKPIFHINKDKNQKMALSHFKLIFI